jgi:HTH-like domain
VIAFLQEENRVLRAHLRGRCLRLSDDERRRLAVLGHQLGRATLDQVATIVRADTILRWHRELAARKCTHAHHRAGRPRIPAHVRSLIMRMATENSTWGYSRIQGALKNLGHCVGRSTIARILKEHGVPPSQQRPMAWRTFVRAHWPALRDADFFTSAVPTLRGLVTYYTAFTGLHTSRTSVRFNVAPGGSLPASGHATIDHQVDWVLGVAHPHLRSGFELERWGAPAARNRGWPRGPDTGAHAERPGLCRTVRALDDRGMRGSRRVARARPSSAGTHAVGGAVSWRAQSQTPEPADRMAAHATSAWSGVRSLASAGTLSSYYRSAA